MTNQENQTSALFDNLPSALTSFTQIWNLSKNKEIFICLDYDGTLTPIVDNPDRALLSNSMKQTLKQLSDITKVAIVSGRALKDIQDFIQLDNIYYAGSHGFNISGPGKIHMENTEGKKILHSLDEAEKELQKTLEEFKHVLIERKKYAIAVHFRNVEQENIRKIKIRTEKIVKKTDHLKLDNGRMIYEIKPDIDWNKGKAILWLMNKLYNKNSEIIPYYIGDDVTDEDGFEAIRENGVTIKVNSYGMKTTALYKLNNVSEVNEFLLRITKNINPTSAYNKKKEVRPEKD